MQAGERGSAAARTGALAGKAHSRRKKDKVTSLDEKRKSDALREGEEDITLSDGEEEPDSVQNSDDENFISDGEHDTSGFEQRAMDASMAYEVGDDAEQYADAIEGVAGRKKRSNRARDDVEEAAKKKERSAQRELLVLHERGLGDTRRLVAEYGEKPPFLLPFSSFVTPWDKQQERSVLDFGMDRGGLAEGAFRIEAHARWMNSNEKQFTHAERFSVPVSEIYQLKSVSTDVPNTPLNPRTCLSNSTTKVLQCLRTMHKQTELDIMDGKYYDKVFLGLQRTSRELRLAMDGGPHGGLQGCAVDVLWKVFSGEEVGNVSESTLRLLDVLTVAKQGSKGDELFHMTTTDRVEWFTKGKTGLQKVQCGVQTKRSYNFQEAAKKSTYCAVKDVDPRLVRKLWTHRYPSTDFDDVSSDDLALSKLVHDRHQVNLPEQMGDNIKFEEQLSTDLSTMRIFLYKDVLPAWDAVHEQTTTVSIEGIYIMSTSPANDPLVFLRSIAENNPTANTLLSDAFKHMRSVLGLDACTWDQLFGTDRAGAAEVTPESRMVEAFFRFCDVKSLFNVQLGGLRMDVRDQQEMRAWQEYVDPLTQARKANYRLLIKETLHDRAKWREAHLPVLNSASWLDFYHGHMYWRVSLKTLWGEIEDYISMFVAEDEEKQVRERFQDWLNSNIKSKDGLEVFLPEGEGWARNSGLWIKIRTDTGSQDDEKQEGVRSKKMDDSFPRWVQPHHACRMIKIWLANAKDRASGQDPLDVVLHKSKWIPDVEWMKHTMPTLDEQHEGLQWLFELIGDYALAASHTKLNSGANPRLLDILSLVGKERNPVHKSVAAVIDSARLGILFRTWIQKINTSIKNSLVQMQGSELLAWKLSSLSVYDLKKQNNLKDKWTENFRHVYELQHNLHASDDWQSLLCAATWPSVFVCNTMERLDADLCYMNQLVMWIFICCTMAHNECRRGCYGMSMRIIDMAGTVDLLKEGDGKMAGKTTVVKVTEKSPGAGADTTISFIMQQFVSAMTHISLTQEVKEMAYTARDTMHKQVSKMSYALFQGSGVLVNSKREIMNTSFLSEISNNGHMTELFKNDDDQLAWIESLMAHSGDVQVGAESGITQAAWSTTQNLENCSVERLKPIPVIVLTGNRPAHSTPASAVEGGRWMHVASSTQDKENGFFVVHKSVQAQCAAKHLLPLRFALSTVTENQQNVHSRTSQKSSRARGANKMSTDSVRTNIKIISRDDVLSNMLHFLLMQWLRKDAALLLATLTHEAQNYGYSMKCTMSRIECSVGQLTKGLRRDFLETNPDYWHRNAMGPWAKVLQISMHNFLTLSTGMLEALSRTREGWPLDLHLGFVSSIRCLMTNTISFMAVLASLHLWLASAVLDYNFMILSCYIYHFSALQHWCPLRVLSLVMRGLPVDDEEFQQYLLFCEHLAPCVLERSVLAERTDFGPRNVASGLLQMPSHGKLADWFSFHVPAMHKDILQAHAARTQGPAQERFSAYCQPRLSFVQTEGIKGFGRPKEGHPAQADPNICGTPSRVLATSLGNAQKPVEQQRRIDKGACIDGQVSSHAGVGAPKLQAWENTVEFWKKVRKGTLLPEASTSTSDAHKIKFEFVPYTGIWWDTTMLNTEHTDGLVQSFLLQSDLDLDVSLHAFFCALFRPYLQHKQSEERVYGGPQAPGVHKNAWKMLVLDSLRPFQFACAPFIDQQHQPQGVEVNICMSLVHYVLVQGLGVTSDWNPAAHDNAEFVSCVHLRNTSHMTLGLLSLLLHTCCEKAMIPANSGDLRLPLPSPVYETQAAAVVKYDSRLHIDTSLHLMGGASDNMLSIDSRLAKKENWRLCVFQNGGCALAYASVISELMHTSQRHVFPFPPEAVAHCADSLKYMAVAHKRFVEMTEKQPELSSCLAENTFALAMLKLGGSMRFEEHQHLQPTLTDCAVRDEREIPCVSCEHGFMFTISFHSGRLLVRPVVQTLPWDVATEVAGNCVPFLPLPAEETWMPSSSFSKLFRHGLQLQETEEGLRVSIDVCHSEHKRLPFYMFPVVHWPVLVRLTQKGWTMPVPAEYVQCAELEDLFLHTCDYFYQHTRSTYHMRLVQEELEWCTQHCPALIREVAALPAALDLTCLEAYFCSAASTILLGLWARVRGVRVHFDSLNHLCAEASRGCPVSDYAHTADTAEDYYMLQQNEWGLTPVRKSADKFCAKFSYFVDPSEEAQYVEDIHTKLAQARAKKDTFMIAELSETLSEHQVHMESSHKELFRDVVFSFTDTVPNMLPYEQDAEPAMWGLTLEQEASFLRHGRYLVSSVGHIPHAQVACTHDMDFITMSRCMLAEGTELWIRVTADVYSILLQQAQDQGSSLMLPVSQALHNNMPAVHSRYLRAFYSLAGSLHDQPLQLNQVRLICVVAAKNSVPGKKNTQDDNADALSRVNQNISPDKTRFVAVSLPILLHGTAVFDHTRDPALPFYKYLKEKPAVGLQR